MTKFLLIRHATTEAVGKKLSGRSAGVYLTEEGKQQAQQLAQQLKNLHIDVLYCSPLERTVETATPLAKALQKEIIINDAFTEVDFGEWTNSSIKDLHSEKQFRLFNSFRSFTRIPAGELMLEAQVRVVAGLQKLVQKHNNETVAIVSHSDVIKAAVMFYAGIHLDLFQRIEISTASVTVIEVYEETARIMLMNYTGDIQL